MPQSQKISSTSRRRTPKPPAQSPPTAPPLSLAAPAPSLTIPPAAAIPPTGYLRLNQIVGDPKKGIAAILPISKTTWYQKVKADKSWPQPIRLSERVTAYLAADVMALVHRLAKGEVNV